MLGLELDPDPSWTMTMATRLRPNPPAKDLYDQDFYAWSEAQADLLRARRFEALDLDNLILEVADLGDAKRSAVLSNAAVIIEHLLKLAHSPATEPRNGWRATVREHRRRLRIDLTPRLRPMLETQLPDLHAMAAADAAAGLRDHDEATAATAALATPPYTFDQITTDWWP